MSYIEEIFIWSCQFTTQTNMDVNKFNDISISNTVIFIELAHFYTNQ